MTCFLSFLRRRASPTRGEVEVDNEASGIQNTKRFTYRELQMATNNFSRSNKIGQGGFGSVYKGTLRDGTMAAIKVLSADSKQGVKEFLTEINVIADIVHNNLVKLYGCCAEGNHRILVYGYLENNSLARTLLGGRRSGMQFSWSTRRKICIGVAEGLAFLHEEVQPHIVHRDIKASNVLLDRDLTPKISDFGLAKLFPDNKTHISTRVAGTVGYMAPEYAVRGQLNRKADIYSFGILLLEIVSGRPNTDKLLPPSEIYLLEMAWELYQKEELRSLVDSSVSSEYDPDEACRYLKVGLLCTQVTPKIRPTMSSVVQMLKCEIGVDQVTIAKPALLSELKSVSNGSNRKDQLDGKNLPSPASTSSGKLQDSPSTSAADATRGTMTFDSIYDRST